MCEVSISDPATRARWLEWAGVKACDLDPCTHPPEERRAELQRRMFDAPAPCARCQRQEHFSWPQLLDAGAAGLRWLVLCASCTDGHLAHLQRQVNALYGRR